MKKIFTIGIMTLYFSLITVATDGNGGPGFHFHMHIGHIGGHIGSGHIGGGHIGAVHIGGGHACGIHIGGVKNIGVSHSSISQPKGNTIITSSAGSKVNAANAKQKKKNNQQVPKKKKHHFHIPPFHFHNSTSADTTSRR